METKIKGKKREPGGTQTARNLRKEGMIPSIVYGLGEENIPVSVDPDEIRKILHSDRGDNTIINLNIDSEGKETVMIKDFQLDPVSYNLLHTDFMRIDMDEKIEVEVPIVPVGDPVGVIEDDGVLDLVHREVEVRCYPEDIPAQIEVDVSDLEISHNRRLSELEVSDKIELLQDPDTVVAVVTFIEEEVEPMVMEEEMLEPELIGEEEELLEGEEEEVEAEEEELEEEGEEPEEEPEPDEELPEEK